MSETKTKEEDGEEHTITSSELERVITDRDYAFLKTRCGGPHALAESLESNPKSGLTRVQRSSSSEGGKRQEREVKFGKNEFEYPPPKTFLQLCVIALEDFTVRILIAAAVVSLAIGAGMKEHRDEYGYLEGIAIVIVVMVVVFLQAYIDYAKEKKFRQLNSVKDNYNVKTVIDGEVEQIPAGEVLVGDVLELTAGDKIPADCVYLEGSKLKTNEAAMTGEPIDIGKNLEKDPFLLSGTSVSEGSGRCVVVAVGGHSQWGAILKTLIVEPQSTPLQERLDALVVRVGNFGIGAAILTFLASFIRWIAESVESGSWDGLKVLNFLINSVTIVVVAIPEGLPLAITLGLAFAMKQMMKDQNLVRRLEACETMGSATQLNADKTGTLTQNRMTVTEAWLGRTFFESMVDEEKLSTISKSFQELLSESCAINSDANLSHKEGGMEHIGSKTECALLQMVEDFGGKNDNGGFRYHQLRESKPVKQRYHFTSARKRMSTAIAGTTSGTTRMHVKGASEVLVELCSKVAKLDGSVDSFSKEDIKDANDAIQRMAERGLRTLAIAYVDLNVDPSKLDPEKPREENLTLLGIVGIKDPIRVETAEAVRLLRGAGVTVRMVTGDNAVTARAIAIEAGIFDPNEEEKGATILEGPVFRKMSRAEQESVAMKIRVLARSSPTDKLVLCNLQRELGEVVSVTGDGTNDAPALKDADVGFALGIAGTEIAKEACDIVIMDDNIKSMAKAVLWGRNVYQSIRKFLQFQLVVNVVAVSLNLIAACAGIEELPLGAVPLLWVNMIMDSMGALALATEPPSDRLMDRQPFGRTAPLVNKQMWRNIIGVSTYQLIVCITLMFAGTSIMGIECPIIDGHEDCHHRTLELNGFIFNAFVFMQVFSEVNSRRISDFNVFEDIHKSGLFCTIILLTVGVQVLFIEVVGSTVVGPAIGFVNLTTKEWITSIVLGVIILPVGALTRCVPLSLFPGVTDEEAMAQAAEETHKALLAAKALADSEKATKALADVQPSASPSGAESPGHHHRRVSVDSVSSSISHAFEAASEAVIASRRASHNEDRSRLSLSRESSLSRDGSPSSLRNRHPSFRRAATMVISANRFRLPTMDTIRDDIDDDEENAIKKMKK
jgi:Ca2+-transporting ATPase